MKSIVICFLPLFFLQSCKTGSMHKTITINEDIEWTQSWVVHSTKTDLIGLLVIGDSPVEAYSPLVAKQLSGKAYSCKFTTSRSMEELFHED